MTADDDFQYRFSTSMSLEIDWSSLGPSVSSKIQDFLNGILVEAELPNILRNIEVLSFDLGTTAPEITLRDITDPFPEFYEDEHTESTEETSNQAEQDQRVAPNDASPVSQVSLSSSPEQRRRSIIGLGRPSPPSERSNLNNETHERPLILEDLETASNSSGPPPYDSHLSHRPMHSASGWEGMNLPYFHSAFAMPSNGIVSASGLSTPRPRFMGGINSFHAVGPMAPESRNVTTTNPLSGQRNVSSMNAAMISGRRHQRMSSADCSQKPDRGTTDDTQVEVHIQYLGDIVMHLKIDLALNYPSPSFVTLPLRMTLSELQVETVAVIAYIKSKLHISLLEGPDNPIKDFKIETQIGDQAKVSISDVGKVEKFMLKEIQNMVERELVFPSYYTLLI